MKTHCCFCGQQCGIQLKVRDNEVIGFEPWEEFPFNRGMLCPKEIEALLTKLASRSPAHGAAAIRRHRAASPRCHASRQSAKVASEIARLQSAHGAGSIGVLSGASLTTEKPTCSASSRACA